MNSSVGVATLSGASNVFHRPFVVPLFDPECSNQEVPVGRSQLKGRNSSLEVRISSKKTIQHLEKRVGLHQPCKKEVTEARPATAAPTDRPLTPLSLMALELPSLYASNPPQCKETRTTIFSDARIMISQSFHTLSARLQKRWPFAKLDRGTMKRAGHVDDPGRDRSAFANQQRKI